MSLNNIRVGKQDFCICCKVKQQRLKWICAYAQTHQSLFCSQSLRWKPRPTFWPLAGGSSEVSALASGAWGPRFDPRSRWGKFRCPNALSLVSFAGMTLDKCIVLQIWTFTGCPMCRESHSFGQVKEPYSNLDMVTCRLSSCNPECTKYTCQ